MYLLGVADLRTSTVDLLRGPLLELREAAVAPLSEGATASKPMEDDDPPAPAPAAWWTLAACRGMPTALWYPERGDHYAAPAARAEEELVGVNFTFGIRGGLTAIERAG